MTTQVNVILEVDQGDSGVWRTSVPMTAVQAVALTDAEKEALAQEHYAVHLANFEAAQAAADSAPVDPAEEGETLADLREQLVSSLARVDELLAARDAAEV